ncbi:hypothetical protein H0H93_004096 [Arthromyces matolae]|nr:hypothetical protein H0H93_004096 [Arthromyces matolae]
MSWSPSRSLEETDAILCGPGHLHELETIYLNGRMQKVYRHLWPSVREFWLSRVKKFSKKYYIVFEGQRFTYGEVHQRATKVAAVFRHVYDVEKGDRIGICSRNCSDYLVSFWAAPEDLIGAVPVLINAWLPLEPLQFCLVRTDCKVVMVDAERADRLAPVALELLRDRPSNFLVFDEPMDKNRWPGIGSFPVTIDRYQGDITDILTNDPQIMPEDNALIMFTSGKMTSLPPKRRQPIHTNHKICRNYRSAKRLIKRENVRVAGGVPAMVSDLIESSLSGYRLEGLLFGGSPAPDTLVPRAHSAFPAATMMQAYGMTETNSIAVSIAGDDYAARPTSTGRASPVNEIKVVRDGVSVGPGVAGEVWLRGPNIMQCYWCDSDATENAITSDGWLRTGDLGYLDKEGFLYIKDRIKDIIIRGGENIDSVAVENALYRDPRVSEAAAVGVPDDRLGELVAAVVSVKPAYRGAVTGASLIATARKHLPRFAVPVMIIVQDEPFELTPSGKIIKSNLRQLAQWHWEERARTGDNHETPRSRL